MAASSAVSVRDTLLGLSASDADARISALRTLASLSTSAHGLTKLLADSTSLPRMCFFVAGLAESPVLVDKETATLSLSILWAMLQSDGTLACTQRWPWHRAYVGLLLADSLAKAIAAECGSRPIMLALKISEADAQIAIPAFHLLRRLDKLGKPSNHLDLRFSSHRALPRSCPEKGTAMTARLEGCLDLLLECLALEPAPQALAMELHAACAQLLAAYCKSSGERSALRAWIKVLL